MRLRLVAVGTRLPAWVEQGFRDYAARLPPELKFELREIPVTQRTPDVRRAIAEEGRRMLGAIDEGMYVVALEVQARSMTTEQLSAWLAKRMQEGRDVALLIGGPDGLDPACRERADQQWSLSPLTFPHGLVRIMVVEQLYRAASLLKGHPYHRA